MKGSKGARGASQTAKKHKPKINIRKKKSNDVRFILKIEFVF